MEVLFYSESILNSLTITIMTNVEMAKKQLREAFQALENLPEDSLEYYNSLNYNDGNVFYNAGITVGHFIGRGLLRGIVGDWKNAF